MSEYPLTVLLKIRESEKDAAIAAYAQASKSRAQARAILDSLQAEQAKLTTRRQDARETRSNAADIQQIQAISEYVAGLVIQSADCETKIAAAAEALDLSEVVLSQKRSEMAKAETALNAVVSHQEKWQQERRAELAKKAAEALDDLAIQRWSQS
jgi:flagellar export protein FliJ